MRISTKGQYALQMMLDLAINDTGEYITIKSIAQRQSLSEKYLEQIINMLSRAGFVKSIRGAKGGYRLCGQTKDITVGNILRTIEGSLAPVDRLDSGEAADTLEEECLLTAVWSKMNDAINNVVDHVTLDDLVKLYQGNVGYDYVI